MTLNIKPEMTSEFIDDVCSISTAMLKFKATHMFIASYTWDTIDITLAPDIDPEDLRFFHTVSDNIITTMKANPSENDINRLCALYPDLAGSIRLTYMQKGNLQKVVPNVIFVDDFSN